MRSGGERAFVAFGANLGDRQATFAAAIARLEREPDVRLVAASPVYETPPLGPPGQDPYLNAVVALHAWLSPEVLLQRLQAIESALGRDRGPDAVRWGPRAVDLDLLFFGDRCVDLPELEVPHPRLHERAFVLVPLADLAPALVHPVRGASVESMLAAQAGLDQIVARPRPAGWPGAR